MSGSKTEASEATRVEVEVTSCPECGTEWEVVVTEHPRPRVLIRHREE